MVNVKIDISDFSLSLIKQKALIWANQQSEVVCYLDSNEYAEDKYSRYECLLAVGAEHELKVDVTGEAFEQLNEFSELHNNWLFGYLNYDLKNELENLKSLNDDALGFPELYFFVPSYLFLFHNDNELEILSFHESPSLIWSSVLLVNPLYDKALYDVLLSQKISESEYLRIVDKIKQHVIDGDTYELNFCQEFLAHNVEVNPLGLFLKMNRIAQAPFAAYFKRLQHHLLCGSPERFLAKKDNKLISQPIKGTIKRGKNFKEDSMLKSKLENSQKDKAENVMIVDLVRNDLAKTCCSGSVKVEELFAVYKFEKVFQMISTVVGTLKSDQHWLNAVKEAFPMGSMTGAPKIISMKLIERYEKSKRGLYAGAVGYVTPERDFDFNVVIRSLFYNDSNKNLSFQVGGAIVFDSDPQSEYNECLLKSLTMIEALSL